MMILRKAIVLGSHEFCQDTSDMKCEY